jgi:sortase A
MDTSPQGTEKVMLKYKTLRYIILVLFLAGLGLIGKGTYIHAKARVAEYLLRSSWQDTIEKGIAIKPWPWADTWPVARMIVPEHGIDLVVLEGASGNVLAFGPGHLTPSSLPGQPGNSIISGHRDTSFRFLERVRVGERITMQTRDGSMVSFKVIDTQIIDQAVLDLNIKADIPLLTLATCYPFDAVIPGGPERYLVFAELDEETMALVSKNDMSITPQKAVMSSSY